MDAVGLIITKSGYFMLENQRDPHQYARLEDKKDYNFTHKECNANVTSATLSAK